VASEAARSLADQQAAVSTAALVPFTVVAVSVAAAVVPTVVEVPTAVVATAVGTGNLLNFHN
jgi:hypothetical protein